MHLFAPFGRKLHLISYLLFLIYYLQKNAPNLAVGGKFMP